MIILDPATVSDISKLDASEARHTDSERILKVNVVISSELLNVIVRARDEAYCGGVLIQVTTSTDRGQLV